jgi:hypothetical protein
MAESNSYLFFGTVFVTEGLAMMPADRAGFFLLLTHRFGCDRDVVAASLSFVFVIVVMDCFWMRLLQNYEKRRCGAN